MVVPEPRSGHGQERSDAIRAATERWTAQLIDLDRRNNLLYFKDLATGTLDLGSADAEALRRLDRGDTVRAAQLFPDADELKRTRRRLAELRRRIRQYRDERGIDAGNVALGMLSWREVLKSGTSADTCAPVLLRPLSITPRGTGGTDFDLLLSPDRELNPVLVYALGSRSGVDLSDIAAEVAAEGSSTDPGLVADRIRERVGMVGVPVTFLNRAVAAAFAYEKMPMVRDLENAADLLAEHPLVAAMAGDPVARGTLGRRPAPPDVDPNTVAPDNEHLVLDADPSQQSVIRAVLDGHDIVVQGPPGTGKSQTIANLLAAVAAAGKTVLFVAQKRAAIDAVLGNLHGCGLAGIALDLHDPKTSRKAFVDQLRSSMEEAGRTAPADTAEIDRVLVTRRDDLVGHSRMLITDRPPSGLSILELEQRVLDLGPDTESGVRLARATLDQLTRERFSAVTDELVRFVEADGLRFWRGDSPWSRAAGVSDPQRMQAVRDQLFRVAGRDRDHLRRELGELLRSAGLPGPLRLADWGAALALLDDVTQLNHLYGDQLFDEDLDLHRAAVASSAWRRENDTSMGLLTRWRLSRAVRRRRRQGADRSTVFGELSRAVDHRDRWAALSGGRTPRPMMGAAELRPLYERVRADLAAIGAAAVVGDVDRMADSEVDDVLHRMREDDRTLVQLPWLNGTRRRFVDLGLGRLIDWMAKRDTSPDLARRALEHAWLDSNLNELQATVPEYGRFSAATLARVTAEFRTADQEHIAATAARVLRTVAERQIAERDRYPDQRTVVQQQISRKARHKPIRQLVEEAPDLLRALRPCWVMSPLAVSQALPAVRLFDVVVFDEASQVEPADAIPAIARGTRVVIAGDHMQLPPTSFFRTSDDGGDETDEDPGAYESILDYVRPLLTSRMLTRHYRSRDDRLIAFSNRAIYGDKLVTFPGTGHATPLHHEYVDAVSEPGSGGFSPAEARRVTELALTHARRHPDRSLGIIALGTKGVDRIRDHLRVALTDEPELAAFFDEDAGDRPFFVKSIESVQGDERDVIILGIGGARTAGGGLNHNFGAVNRAGGERRLNVAVTRARHAMTVVSMFHHYELRDEGKAGLQFLRGFLRFAAGSDASGDDVAARSGETVEQQVREKLTASGFRTVSRYGRSVDAAVDIAVEHPDRPGEFLLAIDTDRPGRHRLGVSIRERERLRPAQLERMGWRYHRISSTGWLRRPDEEWMRLIAVLEHARQMDTAPDRIPESPPIEHGIVDTSCVPERTLPRPFIGPAQPIHQRPRTMLDELVRWIDSDGLLRDESDTVALMRTELGYSRGGKNIDAALKDAVRRVRG